MWGVFSATQDSDEDLYFMTLHKLWTKMSEKDWRTATKSLYILHTILRDCQPDACAEFQLAFREMAKTPNPKNPDHRYFDADKMGELLDAASVEYQEYETAYASFVFQRAKSFTGR